MLTAIFASSSSLAFATLSSSLVCIFLSCVAKNLLFKSRGGLAMYFFFFSVPPSELFYDQKQVPAIVLFLNTSAEELIIIYKWVLI